MRAERLRESTPSDDRVPPSAPANIVRASGGVRSASKGGRNYSWTKTESLAAVLAREAANNMNQGETQEVSGFMNKVQDLFADILPDALVAQMHRRLAQPER